MSDILKSLEAPLNENIPELRSGDIVNVHALVKEGDRERIQQFKGTVIRVRNSGNNANFTVRRIENLKRLPVTDFLPASCIKNLCRLIKTHSLFR